MPEFLAFLRWFSSVATDALIGNPEASCLTPVVEYVVPLYTTYVLMSAVPWYAPCTQPPSPALLLYTLYCAQNMMFVYIQSYW